MAKAAFCLCSGLSPMRRQMAIVIHERLEEAARAHAAFVSGRRVRARATKAIFTLRVYLCHLLLL